MKVFNRCYAYQKEIIFVRQLTDTEKQKLDTKIEEKQELQEKSPNTPAGSKETSGATGFTSSYLWKYGMLALLLCLLVFNVWHLLKWRNFAYDQYGGIMITLALLFNQVAFYLTKKGWKSVVMKTVACVWIVLVFVYMFWIT